MSKLLKKRMAQELSDKLQKIDSFVIFQYNKMSSDQAYRFRREMRAKNIQISVLKNRIAALAFAKIYNVKMDQLLEGPTGIAYGGDSVVEVAKTLIDWGKKEKVKSVDIKGGFIPNRVLNKKEIQNLAKTPPRPVLLSTLAGSFVGLLRQVAGMMKAPLQNMSYAFNEMAQKQEKEIANQPK